MTRINKATLALIKEFEGFESAAYKDAVGVWTIGYGTTAAAGVGISPKAGMTITEAEAETYLLRAAEKFGDAIADAIRVPVNENEFGAFVSLAYNIGPSAFRQSTALKRFNIGDKAGCAEAMGWFCKGTVNGHKVILKGLVRRREAEKALFFTPVAEPEPEPEFSGLSAIIAALVAALFRRTK